MGGWRKPSLLSLSLNQVPAPRPPAAARLPSEVNRLPPHVARLPPHVARLPPHVTSLASHVARLPPHMTRPHVPRQAPQLGGSLDAPVLGQPPALCE